MLRTLKRATSLAALALFCSLSLNGVSIYLQEQAVSPGGSLALLNWGTLLLLVPGMLALVSTVASLPLLAVKRMRGLALCLVLSGIAYFAGAKVCLSYAYDVRMDAFRRLASRSAALIDAIETYHTGHGGYPRVLDELTPDFLDAVPGTGMGAYPEFKYATDPDSWKGNPFVIYVDTPAGGPNWDKFLYFPKQNYPARGYGGVLERVGLWAYVHE
ncbi:MAG: hypothetical protein HZB26_04045 [Candidatus Hydrogenedentes bacterium]|nr:hypothetical protein [Candidatus Hydrogenedentota bacterium]